MRSYQRKCNISEMENNASSRINPWSSLSTITTFDRGDCTRTTVRIGAELDNETTGQIVGRVAPSTSLLIESLIQQLCSMFESDAAQKNKLYLAICDKLHELKLIDSSYSMREFEMLRGQYQRALYHLVSVARASTGSESPLQTPNCLVAEWSRYRREFQEISFIAAGGFGNVFKALHRLDGIEYAIKKIVVRSGRVKTIMQHLEEVKTLAKLNHTNIVPYKGAWIEPTLPSTFLPSLLPGDYRRNGTNTLDRLRITTSSCISQTSDVPNSTFDSNKYVHSESNKRSKLLHRQQSRSENINGLQIFEESNSESNEESNSDVVSFRNYSKSSKNLHSNNEVNTNETDTSDLYEESASNQEICHYSSHMNQQYATLYIQMALCEKTLQEWLDERDNDTPQNIIATILTQIVSGINYIHTRGIVHHDIKPSNIFISTSGPLQIQVGDFGLACPLQRDAHHSVLGTHMYAAPEQLEGKCDPKSDIYSLGIVLLELLVPTHTRMERNSIINGVKQGQIPTTVTAKYPKWAHIVSQLVEKDPARRPCTNELLQELNEDKDITIAQLKNDIMKKDSTILELQEKILSLEAQIRQFTVSLDNA